MGSDMCFYRRVKPANFEQRFETQIICLSMGDESFQYELDTVSKWVGSKGAPEDWHKPPSELFEGEWGANQVFTSHLMGMDDDEPYRRPKNVSAWKRAIEEQPDFHGKEYALEVIIPAFEKDPDLYYYMSY